MTEHENRAIDGQNAAPNDPNHLSGIARVPRLFVNGPGYDDVGRVLRRMGPEFRFESAKRITQASPADSVLFLNCGGPRSLNAECLRRFVDDGGTVYASDGQAIAVARAFPEVFRVSKPMDYGDFSTMVVDHGLKETLGGRLRLHFDAGDWHYLVPQQVESVKIFVSIPGPDRGVTPRTVSVEGIPVVLGYDVPGGGSVFFTAFHGAAQQSRKIKELIRFLVLRPVMSGDIRTARLTIPDVARADGLELFGVLSSSAPLRDCVIHEAGTWRVCVSWQGTAKLRLEMHDRDGVLRAAAESTSSPLAATAYASAGGYVRVCAMEIPNDQIPYCVFMNKTVG